MKNLRILAEKYNLEVIDEQLSFLETIEAVKGEIKNYYVSILVDLRDYTVKINIDKKTDRSKINNLLDELKKEFRGIKKAQVKRNYIEIILHEGNSKKVREDIEKIVDRIIDFLEKEGTVSCCGFCGISPEEGEIKATQVIKNESEIYYLCENCHNEKLKELEKNKKEMASVKENYILGFLGSLLGASVGGILWIIIGALGYMAAVSVIVILLGGILGYTLFTKKNGSYRFFSVYTIFKYCNCSGTFYNNCFSL